MSTKNVKKSKHFKQGDKISWEVNGKGGRYVVDGVVIGFVPKDTSAKSKLPATAKNQRLPKSGLLAAWRIHGRDVNTLNDRYLIKAEVGDEVHFYLPSTTKIHKQLNINE